MASSAKRTVHTAAMTEPGGVHRGFASPSYQAPSPPAVNNLPTPAAENERTPKTRRRSSKPPLIGRPPAAPAVQWDQP
jgi:hypothetical protein